MAWTTPKTNWSTSDYFTCVDFNRIKNNIYYIWEEGLNYFPAYEIISMGNDRTYSNLVYADEINAIEDNLESINTNTYKLSTGSKPTFYDNGYFLDWNELNRIEDLILRLYQESQKNKREKKRMFEWNFGKGIGL